MRLPTCLLGVVLALNLAAQPFQSRFQKSYEPQFFDYFLSSAQKQVYFSPDGQRLMMSSDLRYQIIDAHNGEILTEGKHIGKTNAGVASIFGVLRNKSFNREDAIEKARFDEGTEYLVLPEEGLVIFLDWNLDQNIIKAVELKTGKVRWSVDRYRYSSSKASQYVDLVLGMANAGRLQRNTPRDIAVKTARLQGFGAGTYMSDPASPAAFGFLTPMPGTGMILARIKKQYVALDLQTGAERWVYDKRELNFGFVDMTEDGALLAVNFHSSFFKSGQKLIVKIDPQTGQEIWTAEHLSNFREGRTYLQGDRLICDYYGAEVFDVKTGERVLLSIDERVIKSQNTVTTLFSSDASGGRGTDAISSPSVLAGDYLYTSTFKLGKRVYANDGSSKALVQKYDLRTGKQLWESKKLSVGTDLSYASPSQVFVRKGKAFGKSMLYVLDASSGEIIGETPTIEGFIYREGAADVLTENALYRGGKKNFYAFSQTDWNITQTYNAKAAKVGKLQVMIPAGDALLSVGDKGLVFFDGKGKTGAVTQTATIRGTYWNDRFGFLITDKGTVAVDLAQQQQTGQIPSVPNENTLFFFTEDGRSLAVIRDTQHIEVFDHE